MIITEYQGYVALLRAGPSAKDWRLPETIRKRPQGGMGWSVAHHLLVAECLNWIIDRRPFQQIYHLCELRICHRLIRVDQRSGGNCQQSLLATLEQNHGHQRRLSLAW